MKDKYENYDDYDAEDYEVDEDVAELMNSSSYKNSVNHFKTNKKEKKFKNKQFSYEDRK